MKRSITLFVLTLILLLAASAVLAQTGGASLGGRVTDESGAALPGVTVTATNSATGFNRSRGILLPSNGSLRRVTGSTFNGSYIVGRPEKSPPRTFDEGSENVRVRPRRSREPS